MCAPQYCRQLFIHLLLPLIYIACSTARAEDGDTFKKYGVGVVYKTQQQELKLNELRFDNPALLPLSRAKDLIVIDGEIETKGIQLDYRAKPYLKLFGSVEQSRGTGLVKLSQLPVGNLPDLKINTDGTLYSVGATLFARDQDYFATLSYIHTLTDMKSASQTNTSYAIMPTVGKKTPVGAFDLGARYQHSKSDYQGTLSIPALGNVNTTMRSENTDKLSYIAGFHTEMGKDFYLHSYLEFGDREGGRLELGHRF